MYWLLLSFCAPFIWAISNVGDKYLLAKWIKLPSVALVFFGLAGIMASIVVWAFKGFGHIEPRYLLLALFTGLVYFAANLFYYQAVKTEEISRVIVLIYLEPVGTAVLAAVFLGETFPLVKYLGVALTVCGAVAISYSKTSRFRFSKGVWLAILAAGVYSINTVLNKYLVDRVDPVMVFAYVRLGTFLGILPVLYYVRRDFISLFKTGTGFALVLANNVLSIVGVFLFTIAISVGYVTLTTTLTAAQPFFVLVIVSAAGLFYPHVLKEQGGKRAALQKLFAIVLMFIGVILIT